MATAEMIFQTRTILHNLILTKWLTEDVLSPRWWSLIAIIAFSYILCFKLFDKRRISTLFLFGSLVAVGDAVYETIGVNFLLWSCLVPVFPTMPCLLMPYLTVLPVFYMLIFQYTATWRHFSIWNLIAASVLSLVILPIFSHFKIYAVHNNWHSVYQIPFLFGITSLARAVTLLLIGIEQRQEKDAGYFSSQATFHQPAMKPTDDRDRENKP